MAFWLGKSCASRVTSRCPSHHILNCRLFPKPEANPHHIPFRCLLYHISSKMQIYFYGNLICSNEIASKSLLKPFFTLKRDGLYLLTAICEMRYHILRANPYSVVKMRLFTPCHVRFDSPLCPPSGLPLCITARHQRRHSRYFTGESQKRIHFRPTPSPSRTHSE